MYRPGKPLKYPRVSGKDGRSRKTSWDIRQFPESFHLAWTLPAVTLRSIVDDIVYEKYRLHPSVPC